MSVAINSKMRTALYILGGVALFLGILFAYDRFRGPVPVKELLPADAGVDLSAYEGSMPSSAGSPAVLSSSAPPTLLSRSRSIPNRLLTALPIRSPPSRLR